jgi:hypothetical protein
VVFRRCIHHATATTGMARMISANLKRDMGPNLLLSQMPYL